VWKTFNIKKKSKTIMQLENKNILVTGGNGFLGSAIVNEIKKKRPSKIIIPSSKDCDLRIQENCKNIMKDIDVVFHLAAHVGGIGLNREKPGELFYDNIMMGVQLLHEAKEANVKKFISLGTVCSYPKYATIPFTEDSIWDGFPEETNAPYGLAKKMMLVQSESYKKQYNFNSIVVIPTNLYGPNDNFNPSSSHVIPALILKIFLAKKNNMSEVSVWGDGTPTRDFLFVEDAAKGVILAAEKYDENLPLNLSSSEEISIKKLVEIISNLLDYDGNIIWDETKPNGQPRRCVSYERAKKTIGFEPEIKIQEGIKSTVDWFLKNSNSYS
jgi:GDP-L-fucose synthase